MSRPRRRRACAAVLGAVAVVLAGCAQGGPAPAPASPGGSTPEVQVPDAFTAIVVHPVSPSTFPFPGTDGKFHLAYDLQLTNAARVPATLTGLDVVDAQDPTRVIVSYTGTKLVDPNCPFGDCNRLRLLPSANATSADIPAQESRALLVDVAFDTLDAVPKAVLHRVHANAAAGPPAKEPTPVDYLAGPLSVSAGTPRVLGPPLKGDHWVALNGCCLPGFPHRTSLATFNGQLVNGQRFAIDWKRVDDNGRFFEGDRTRNESYVDYGAGIYAVADGTVVATLDELDPNTPGILPATDPVLAPKITIENVDGNHIVEDIGGGEYAFYAHLQKGTLLVKPGDHVTKGQMIAKLGNTGNANASHLHFHVMTGPSVLGNDGVPYVIDGFNYDGQVDPAQIANADDYLSGQFLSGRLPAPQPRTDKLPMAWAIIDFPS
jgi:murein DD-endopeptidase MepM/ murein hydrolase activator NlpD